MALSRKKMKAWLASDLSELDLLVIQIDGLHIGDHVLMAAIGVDGNGDKQYASAYRSGTVRGGRCFFTTPWSKMKDGTGSPVAMPARTAPSLVKCLHLAATLIGIAATLVPGVGVAGDVYLRAGIGFDLPAETRFMDKDCSSVSPAALYGCGTGGDGAPLRSLGDFGTVAGVEFGVGHILTRATRVEVLVEYRPRFAFDGRANFLAPARQQSVSADLSSLSGMLAAYLDLPELGVPRLGRFSPFLGGGVGAVRVEIGETRMAFPKTTTIVPGARRVNLAWMLTAGVATSLGDDTTLELAWRYTDLGLVETGEGRGRVVWRDGSREPLPLDLAPTRAKLRSHGLRLSLRYGF